MNEVTLSMTGIRPFRSERTCVCALLEECVPDEPDEADQRDTLEEYA